MKKFEQDYKYLYKQKVEEVKVLEKALGLACEVVWIYEDYTSPRIKPRYYINQAKKEMEE